MPANETAAWKAYAKTKNELLHIPKDMYEKQLQLESGWNHYRPDGSIISSPTGSMGLGQLNSHFYPESDWRDPYTNLDKSMELMASYKARFGTWRKALAAYNWGPGNVGGYTDNAGHVHPAWDGTRAWICPVGAPQCSTGQRNAYLDVILGPSWAEPGEVIVQPTPAPTYSYNFGIANLAAQLGSAVVGTPTSPEVYITSDFSVQYSTKGKFEYNKFSNQVSFFPAVQGR